MPTLAPVPQSKTVSAASLVQRNWERNRTALAISQSSLGDVLTEIPSDKEWLLARDGSLTAMQANGRWWADCSVPLLASRALLKSLQAASAGSCLLCPGHAGMVVASRERIGPWATLFVIQPDVEIGRMILACHDFSEQIRQHRLWPVIGENWADQLRQIFAQYPGLATPVQFIRTKLTPDTLITQIIADTQTVLSEVVTERAKQIVRIQAEPLTCTEARKMLLIGATQFRLWEDSAAMLHAQLSNHAASNGISIDCFDTDEPLSGSPLALLEAARNCGCVISANLCRPDCNNLISMAIPWITWMTQPGAPPFESAGEKDWLILADSAWRTFARKAGWPEDRVKICGFPPASAETTSQGFARELAIFSNTCRIEIPASIKQFSSHRLLWELIEEELRANPFAVEKIDDYLTDRSGQLNISGDVLDRRTFIQQLILPAYEQGLARILISAGAPLALWGEGWSELEEFASAACGPLMDRNDFNQAVRQATALVYCWPEKAAHPIETTGKPLVHRAGHDRAQFIRNAERALSGAQRRAPVTSDSSKNLPAIILGLITLK